MPFEQKDGSGALFKNDRKKTDNHPDYQGSIKVGGIEYRLAAWLKEGKNGDKYMKLSATPKENGRDLDRALPPTGGGGASTQDDEDIPFIVSIDINPERRFRI